MRFTTSSFLSACIWCTCSTLMAQDADAILHVIELDSISIIASKEKDLDIKEFINWMIQDQSFYKAFKNLRSTSYTFSNQIELYDKDKSPRASYSSTAIQSFDSSCRTMTEVDRKVEGDFFDRSGDYKWYTAKLYDRLFLTHGKVCQDSSGASDQKTGRMEKNIQELKKLMFSPGERTHVPLLGDKTAIFDEQMQPYYDYRFQIDTIQGLPCYLFEVEVKSSYQQKDENKTVIKKLQTWFSQESHQVIRRDYHLVGKTIAYSFDVMMHVDIMNKQDRNFPSLIQYDGTWKIISKKREHAKFTIAFTDFKY